MRGAPCAEANGLSPPAPMRSRMPSRRRRAPAAVAVEGTDEFLSDVLRATERSRANAERSTLAWARGAERRLGRLAGAVPLVAGEFVGDVGVARDLGLTRAEEVAKFREAERKAEAESKKAPKPVIRVEMPPEVAKVPAVKKFMEKLPHKQNDLQAQVDKVVAAIRKPIDGDFTYTWDENVWPFGRGYKARGKGLVGIVKAFWEATKIYRDKPPFSGALSMWPGDWADGFLDAARNAVEIPKFVGWLAGVTTDTLIAAFEETTLLFKMALEDILYIVLHGPEMVIAAAKDAAAQLEASAKKFAQQLADQLDLSVKSLEKKATELKSGLERAFGDIRAQGERIARLEDLVGKGPALPELPAIKWPFSGEPVMVVEPRRRGRAPRVQPE